MMKALETPEPRGTSAPSLDGVAFFLLMAVAAFLGRENPRFVHPQILWSFLGLLAFNLANFAWLSRRMPDERRAPLSITANILLVSLIVRYSGGAQSYFWVMYLQPIFTACLSLRRKGTAAALGAVLLILGFFHAGAWSRLIWAETLAMLSKMFTLLISALVTMRAASSERRALRLLSQEQERAALERQRMREQVQHMDRLATLGTLLAGIAHELNRPLSAILGYAEFGLADGSKSEKAAQALQRIDGAARRCTQTLQDMLAFARNQKSERKPTDVNALLHECLGLKRFDWVTGNIRSEERYAAGLPLLSLSGSEIQQVVFNLITNAEQAIRSKPEGAGLIRLSTQADAGVVRVTVEDDGPGIPAEAQEKIWEPFFTTKPAGTGTGLGLSISRRIIEEHGGKLSVTSAPGRGASFTIELPVARGTASSGS